MMAGPDHSTIKPQRAPAVPTGMIIGLSLAMRNDPLGTMDRAFERFGGEAVYLRLGPYRATLIRHPDLIKHVFIDNAANYNKQTRGYDKAKLVLGHGLVTSEGELWQRQRRIANPAFSRGRVTGFAGTMVTATEAMLDAWRGRGTVDVFREMMSVHPDDRGPDTAGGRPERRAGSRLWGGFGGAGTDQRPDHQPAVPAAVGAAAEVRAV